MMVHAARRGLLQFFDRGIDRARREVPVVADFIIAAGRGVESNLHAVFEHDGSARRRHGDHAFTAGRIQVDQQIAVGIAHLAALVPAPHPGMAQRFRVALGIRGEHIRAAAD